MYIPVVGFLVILLLFSNIPSLGASLVSTVASSPVLLAVLAVLLIIVMFTVSILFSIRIMKNKEI